jgi:hypothetical protein
MGADDDDDDDDDVVIVVVVAAAVVPVIGEEEGGGLRDTQVLITRISEGVGIIEGINASCSLLNWT